MSTDSKKKEKDLWVLTGTGKNYSEKKLFILTNKINLYSFPFHPFFPFFNLLILSYQHNSLKTFPGPMKGYTVKKNHIDSAVIEILW